jgi:hypothetical protein
MVAALSAGEGTVGMLVRLCGTEALASVKLVERRVMGSVLSVICSSSTAGWMDSPREHHTGGMWRTAVVKAAAMVAVAVAARR